ncbi:M23 family metallopeptidase [Asanoa hainanensis]|nr:M23 family metallopeptidase [Asanoa hainanensis]
MVGQASLGRPIVASYSGTVMASGDGGDAGLRVRLWHGGGWQTEYYHMRDWPLVSVGQFVQQGQVLGFVGSTGKSSGPHLHYAQRSNGSQTSNGTVVQSYFNGAPSGITHDNSDYGYNDISQNCHGGLYREPNGVMAVAKRMVQCSTAAAQDFNLPSIAARQQQRGNICDRWRRQVPPEWHRMEPDPQRAVCQHVVDLATWASCAAGRGNVARSVQRTRDLPGYQYRPEASQRSGMEQPPLYEGS